MFALPSEAWKLALTIGLAGAILAGACGTAPRRTVAHAELRRLVLGALCLYAVGALATLTDHPTLAALLFAAGILICAFALWLSRGRDRGEEPPRGREGPFEPPPHPDGLPPFDFAAFERQFREYVERSRPPALR